MTGIVYCPVSGKRSYATYHEALRALRHIQSSPHRHRKHAGVYLCELGCGAHHITENLDQRKRQKRRAAKAKAERA
jgi:hypothetical protein